MIASCGMRASCPLIIAKIDRADEREAEAHPVDRRRVRVVALTAQQRDRRAERRDLREREVDEDHAALDDVQAEVGVDAGDDQAGGERPAAGTREIVQSMRSYFRSPA